MKPLMGNWHQEEKSSYLDGLRGDSTLLEDFVEPCKTQGETVELHHWSVQITCKLIVLIEKYIVKRHRNI